jgi:hypothetical protein
MGRMTHQDDIAALRARNARVEADKAWEVSWTRRALLAALTYAGALALLALIDAPRPALAALVPATAYGVSTLTLGWAKRAWLARRGGPGVDS